MKKVILSGIRPTGRLHLGHYLGAIKNWSILQDEYDSFFEIADVQALTDNFNNPKKIKDNINEIVIDILASGVDPNKATLFLQSKLPEIAELTVFYSNMVTIARLYRNPTVKAEIMQKQDIFGNKGEGVTYGFVGYPVSQAADITIFNADLVPVGDDQLPLIEQCREIVRKFNNIYNTKIKEPDAYLSKNPRIKGLDGNNKMSKSLGNAIYLRDSDEEIEKKIMKALTDPNKVKRNDPADPNKCMVYYYHKLIDNKNLNTIYDECISGARGCVDCKKELIKEMKEFLKPIQERAKYYEDNPEEVKNILEKGSDKAKKIAEKNMKEIKQALMLE